ncbi:MAG: sulfurtransferase [Xenococcaceae cyanobacterium]
MNNHFVSCQWLAENLGNTEVVVIDCRFQLNSPTWGYEQYCNSHIPGAYYLDLDQDLSSSVKLHGGRHPLPNLDQFATKLASIGIIHSETLVVAYDDSRLAFAARLWWLLRYLGHDRVAVVDGGWNAWQQGNYPTIKDIPSPQQGSFTPQPRTDWIVDRETVKIRKDLPEVVLVDSRDSDRYQGKREPIDPIAGSIPGALNSPWKQVTNDRGYLIPLQEQAQLWSSYQSKEEIIVYCGSGVTACVNLLSLQLAGIDNAKLYPGGWSDWCSYLISQSS